MDSISPLPARNGLPAMCFNAVSRARDAAASLLAPQTCVVCGLPAGRAVPLCHACETERLGTVCVENGRCERCGRPLVSARSLCVDCRTVSPFQALDRVYPLHAYDYVAQELLAAWKVSGNFGLTGVFAGAMARVLPRLTDSVIVPVPPRPGKIRKKGWDQIDVLVRHLERVYGFKVLRCLRRTSVIQQKGLGRTARLGNLKGNIVYVGRDTPDIPVILVDDLMTTGATLESCAAVLKEAQFPLVSAMTLFYD